MTSPIRPHDSVVSHQHSLESVSANTSQIAGIILLTFSINNTSKFHVSTRSYGISNYSMFGTLDEGCVYTCNTYHTCTHMYTYKCTCVHTKTYIHNTHTSKHTHTVNAHTHIHTHTHTHTNSHTHIHTHKLTHTHTHTHI